MSHVNHRYFQVTSGPLIDRLRELQQLRVVVGETWHQMAKAYGATTFMADNTRGLFVGAKFKVGETPLKVTWRPHRFERGLWLPKKTTREGRGAATDIARLPRIPSMQLALLAVGLSAEPCLLENRHFYSSVLHGSWAEPDPCVYVIVPWLKAGADADEIRRDNADHLAWQPHETMAELKHWEYVKATEDPED